MHVAKEKILDLIIGQLRPEHAGTIKARRNRFMKRSRRLPMVIA